MEQYCYRLLSKHDTIRLIVLLPWIASYENDFEVECTIIHVDLADNPQYAALSYCWGDSNAEPRQIFCDGARLEVTQNLYSALCELRDWDKPRCLWIDAICINQSDIDERNRQLPLMRSIYHQSQYVLIWLGVESADVKDGLEFAKTVARNSEVGEELPPAFDGSWRAFFAVFQRPWFRRIWVIQEVAVSVNAWVICCGLTISWKELVRAFQCSMDLGIQPLYNASFDLDRVHSIERARVEYCENNRQSLLKLLLRHRSQEATDPRDKAFALLGLADDADLRNLHLTPNYQGTVDEIYTNIAVAILSKDRNLDLFSATHTYCASPVNTLPSWAPDWSTSDGCLPFRHLEMHHAGERADICCLGFRATGDSTSSPQFYDGNRRLALSGYIIDEIELVGSTFAPNFQDPFNIGEQCNQSVFHLDFFSEWEKIAAIHSRTTYVTGEKMLDCYWQTLSGGFLPGGYRLAREEFYTHHAMTHTVRFLATLGRLVPFLWSKPWFKILLVAVAVTTMKIRGYNIQELGGFKENTASSHLRRIMRTQKGYIGLVPRQAQQGDCIGLFKGGKLPLVVRQNGHLWQLIGEAYIHGVMKGEIFEEQECEMMWFC
ncbi:heterokaryon incompatibility protein-domain-containing protein [Bisporella sp. PMI_857]|nr:heterokaryon incompatibility protein-domain-containing protein [Bisporella sp. PMI_857]